MAKACCVKKALSKYADRKRAKILSRFFKTGKGEYGEGDVFLGITVPLQRKVVKRFYCLQMKEIQKLLASKIHEHRMAALLILVGKFERGNEALKREIFKFYIANSRHINNWDLVDLTAPKIAGGYLIGRPKDVLFRLAKSRNLWKRRIAIVSTYAFIRKGEFSTTLKISKMLLNDKHYLIHKAVGWMLREVGKRNLEAEEKFLMKHMKGMPRTMLRYAIEKFGKEKREFYLHG